MSRSAWDWLSDELKPIEVAIVLYAEGFDGGSIYVDRPHAYESGDFVLVHGTGEVLRLRAFDQLTRKWVVTRGWAWSSPAAIAAGSQITLVGSS